MTHDSPQSVTTETSVAAPECPRCAFILMDGTKVSVCYCPEANVSTIDEFLPVPRQFTLVLPATAGPGVFLVSFRNLNPIEPAERLPA